MPVNLVKMTAIALQAEREFYKFFLLIGEGLLDSRQMVFCQRIIVVKSRSHQVGGPHQAGGNNAVNNYLVCRLTVDIDGLQQGPVTSNFLTQPCRAGRVEENQPMKIGSLLPSYRGHAVLLEERNARGQPLRLQAGASRCKVAGRVESGQK